jgi:hypothetical protein
MENESSMRTVTLRFVGLFFNKKVVIDDTVSTVQGVMDTYIQDNGNLAKPGGLAYFLEADDQTLKEVLFHYEGKFDIDVKTPKIENQGKTLGGKTLKAGVRSLRELRVDDNVVLAWQYYVENEQGTNKSKTKAAEKFKPFGDKEADYEIEDGDTIIWRLVAINLTEEEERKKRPYNFGITISLHK